jgi:hypothetical protein
MAISSNIKTENSQYGIAFDGAYYRIITTTILRNQGDDLKFVVTIDLSGYATTPNDVTREVDFKRYNVSLTEVEATAGDTFLAKCYTWIMTQDDMAGSSAV